MRGRKPKPSALAKLHGNPGKRAKRKGEPKPAAAGEGFAPPAHLGDVARAEWARIVPELRACGMLASVDRAALAAYCACYARWAQAEAAIAKTAAIVATPNKMVQQSPWVSIANRALELMHKFLTEFGMTPASRVRLGGAEPPPPDPGDDDGDSPRRARRGGDDLESFLDQHPDRTLN